MEHTHTLDNNKYSYTESHTKGLSEKCDTFIRWPCYKVYILQICTCIMSCPVVVLGMLVI